MSPFKNERRARNDYTVSGMGGLVMGIRRRARPSYQLGRAGSLAGVVFATMGGILTVAVLCVTCLSPATALAGETELFGIESFNAGLSTAEAGQHPDFTTEFTLNHEGERGFATFESAAFELPPGLIANPNAATTCPVSEFAGQGPETKCPISSQVGVIKLKIEGLPSVLEPIYNLQPSPNEPARFGFVSFFYTSFINVSFRPGDYGVNAVVVGANAAGPPLIARATFWGVPADPIHDEQRLTPEEAVFSCDELEYTCAVPGGRPANIDEIPFMSNSTACQAQEVRLGVTSYQLPGAIFQAAAPLPATTGCDKPPFKPSLQVEPTNHAAGQPTGLTAVLRIPQSNSPTLPASAEMKRASVTLPAGMTISAGAGDGLAACSADQVGAGLNVSANCPDAAKIGSAEFVSPDLRNVLKGSIYQRTPEPGNLFQIWLVADEFGIHLKIPGVIKADPETGQLTATFDETPQLPVETISLEFKGGPRAPLRNPDSCGVYQAQFSFTPWSSTPPVTGVSPFTVSEDCSGGGFEPKLSAGTENPVAGSYSPLVLSLTRQDGEQNVQRLTATLPPGLLAKLAGVPLCPDSAAGSGACPSDSQIGTANVAAGSGSNPLWLPQPGKEPTAVYLAGPYKGAPYSLVVKVPAQAGPFDLGTVAVRTALQINPQTAQVTAESDPLPQILEGVPVLYRDIDVNVNRPEFALNPTNCEARAVEGKVVSSSGATATPQSRFQVAGCASLPFKPQLSASTQGHTSKADGASLKIRITSSGIGSANIAKVDLTIPAILPSRLTTLQKACTEAQFNANPAGCPSASNIATATVHTPLLPDPLSGPVYFVSHGGAAFPDTEIILQGDNVKLVLDGHTQITKGVTYSRFESVPDAPFTSFEFNAPEGPYSIFGASGNLCETAVRMPTTLVAQSGAVINQSTLVEPEGCPNKITILSHKVKKRALTLKVAVPGAGKLTATGNGLSKGSTTAKGRSIVTLTLKVKAHGKLRLHVKLGFTPAKGRRLAATVAAIFNG